MNFSKYIKHITVAAVIAVALVVFAPALHADGFYNCVTYWWYTDCSWIDFDLMNADQNSIGFEAMYRLCQMVGLCP